MHSRLLAAIVVLLVSSSITAQVHQATPVEQMLRELRAKYAGLDHSAMMNAPTTPPSPIPADFNTSAARTFNIVARQFEFVISPLPFAVNVGDSVTLNITAADVQHGFALERFAPEGRNVRPNETATVSFVANTAGTFTFVCTVFCGIGHERMDGTFTVTANATPGPTVASFSPTSGPATGGTSVTISGSNFQQGATVRFGAVNAGAVTFVNSGSLSAIAPAQAAGSVAITVTNPDGQSANRTGYTYTAVSGVSITSVTPASGGTSGNEVVTIAGTGFASGAQVLIGGERATNVAVTPTSITASTPLGRSDFANTMIVDVEVRNPDGTGAIREKGFTYSVPALAIERLSTPTASPGGGTSLTITGRGFTSALPITVTIGGVAATDIKVINAVSISAIAPPRAAGPADVVVTVGSQSASPNPVAAITYRTAPPRRRAARP